MEDEMTGFTIRLLKSRKEKLHEMARETGDNAGTIARKAIYERLKEWEAEKADKK